MGKYTIYMEELSHYLVTHVVKTLSFLPPKNGNGKLIHVYTTKQKMVIFLGDGF